MCAPICTHLDKYVCMHIYLKNMNAYTYTHISALVYPLGSPSAAHLLTQVLANLRIIFCLGASLFSLHSSVDQHCEKS